MSDAEDAWRRAIEFEREAFAASLTAVYVQEAFNHLAAVRPDDWAAVHMVMALLSPECMYPEVWGD